MDCFHFQIYKKNRQKYQKMGNKSTRPENPINSCSTPPHRTCCYETFLNVYEPDENLYFIHYDDGTMVDQTLNHKIYCLIYQKFVETGKISNPGVRLVVYNRRNNSLSVVQNHQHCSWDAGSEDWDTDEMMSIFEKPNLQMKFTVVYKKSDSEIQIMDLQSPTVFSMGSPVKSMPPLSLNTITSYVDT